MRRAIQGYMHVSYIAMVASVHVWAYLVTVSDNLFVDGKLFSFVDSSLSVG